MPSWLARTDDESVVADPLFSRSLHDPVYRAAGDAEKFGDFGAGVPAAVVEGDEVFFLGGGELGLLAPEPALGPGDLHACESQR